ncbi:hypothetical protein LGQ10_05835 [Pseudomonas sp. L5B5]|uniref:DUF6896 domain-containing protein n=1 Tax=Pseudomonas sp. L5B5 TaxID=2883205 RepID=UPI001CF9C219|nr:hypothetical protein [Pseudomonas sp. L5B5]UCZ85824.1 hypothetical protein LGQ10_05835 [Pseudomonas sp. L5B5]
MHPDLARLIHDYQARVRSAVELIRQSGIALPVSNVDWLASDIADQGELAGGIRYFKHGYGCAVHLPSGIVDFDFGEHAQIDGVTVSRLAGFAGPGLADYGFADQQALQACFDQAVTTGSVVHSNYMLYYVADNSDWQAPLEDHHDNPPRAGNGTTP